MITTLHDPVVTDHGGELRLQIQLTYAPGTIEAGTVTYTVQPGGTAVADPSVLPLVPAAIVLASRVGQDLRVTEALPPAIHRGARQVAALLHDWYGWRPAELIAPLGPEPVRPAWAHRRRGLGVFFTRGVDSWGTLLDLIDGPRWHRPTHLVTVDNEVHLDVDVRNAQIVETQAAADELGLPLIVVRTDIRSLLDPHTDWGTQTHGSVLAGIGALLRPTLREIVISPTHWTPLQRPWGSHPDLDPAWSLPDLTVTHHDGSEMRWQRVERITTRPAVTRSLMVCWQGTGTRNCGRCEKCLRLLTTLALLDRLEETADRFDTGFDPARITPDLVASPHPWCDTIDHLDRVGLRADPLRQRWEQVQVRGRPAMWFQTRPVQPRVPLALPAGLTADERSGAVLSVGRALAPIGVRLDHQQIGEVEGPALSAEAGPEGWTGPVILRTGADAVAALPAELRLDDVVPLLDALGLDADTAQPFDPDGQDPPPVVPEPPDWLPAADDGTGSRR